LLGDEDVVLRLDANTNGWSGNVVVTDGDTNPDCPVGVIRCIDNRQVELTPATAEIRFDSRGYLAGFTETVLCLRHAGTCGAIGQHRALTILPSGRVETVPLACNAAWPGLRGGNLMLGTMALTRRRPMRIETAGRERGFTLIEVLIALLVLTIGLVGMAALHMTSLKNAHSSYYRSIASSVAAGC
jgi:prepilin-type N-terminal cleavage/methylation domain-containing protein